MCSITGVRHETDSRAQIGATVSIVDILSPSGEKAGSIELPAEIFGVEKISVPLVHQVAVARWRRPRPAATRLLKADPEENEGREQSLGGLRRRVLDLDDAGDDATWMRSWRARSVRA